MSLPPMSADALRLRARLAHNTRFNPDAPETEALALEFRSVRLADHIKAQIETAPPLTDEMREDLARILRPTSAPAGDVA